MYDNCKLENTCAITEVVNFGCLMVYCTCNYNVFSKNLFIF